MITFAWRQIDEVEPKRSYTALLGYVRLKNFMMLPRFVWYSMKIETQLRHTAGLVGYRMRAIVFAGEFLHLSAWESENAIQAFVHQQPHLGIMKKLAGRLGKIEFRYWTVQGSELPLVFERELHRLGSMTLQCGR